MKIVNGVVVLELRPCIMCDGKGTKIMFHPCRYHNMAVNRMPGRRCPDCGVTSKHNHKYFPDTEPTPCAYCHASGMKAEDAGDNMPMSMWESLTFRVYRSERAQTWNEAYLGMGSVYSVTDYGEHKKLTDDALIMKVRSGDQSSGQSSGVQACRITRSWDDLRICDHVGIFTNYSGYTVIAVHPVEDSK